MSTYWFGVWNGINKSKHLFLPPQLTRCAMKYSVLATRLIDWFGQLKRGFIKSLTRWWTFIGISIFLAVLNLIVGLATLSYLRPKKEPILFGLVCLGIVLALGHFVSLCYIFQRAKDEFHDPTYMDASYGMGVALLFVVSGIALTVELPSRCFSGKNAHFKAVGQGCCVSVTTMAISSWLAVVITCIASAMIFLAARKAIKIAEQPPPVFPSAAEAPILRWLDRNDPFRAPSPRPHLSAV